MKPKYNIEVWPNALNISTQNRATLLHDVVTCVEWTGQTHATYRNRVAKRTQHVVPNNVARCCVEMLRAFGQAFRRDNRMWWSRVSNAADKSSRTSTTS